VEEYARALADGIEAALPGWVEESVCRLMTAWAGSMPGDVAAAAKEAGRQAQAAVGPMVRQLLEADIDDQATTPLAVLRGAAVPYPTAVLAEAGVPPVQRDELAEQLFPGDPYDLAPASFADLDPGLKDVGLAWGAAKAFEHRRRHGA
jgi:hypothetical protein